VNHEAWLESAAAYALGALDTAECAAFEAHLASCARCRGAVHESREVAGLLAHSAPETEPPAALRARVLAAARSRAPLVRRMRSRAVLPWLAAAAALVAAVGAGAVARQTATRNAALAARLDAQDSTLAALAGPRVHVVSLAAPGGRPAARVFWNHERSVFVVVAFALPPAPAERTYQLWAIAEGKAPVSMGTFNTAADGRGTAILPVDAAVTALGTIGLCGLTEEPLGGSAQPTEAPRLLGAWRHTD
jgi:anti-sigma-K factor RskA